MEEIGQFRATIILLGLFAFIVPFIFYYSLRLRPANSFNQDNDPHGAGRLEYEAWRGRLHSFGISKRYSDLVSVLLNTIDKVIDDKTIKNAKFPHYWSLASLNKCIYFSILYPFISIVLVWTSTGASEYIEQSLLLDDHSLPERLISAAALFGAAFAYHEFQSNSEKKQKKIKSIIYLAIFIALFLIVENYIGFQLLHIFLVLYLVLDRLFRRDSWISGYEFLTICIFILVCSLKSGPLFELVPASDMELRHGQEIYA